MLVSTILLQKHFGSWATLSEAIKICGSNSSTLCGNAGDYFLDVALSKYAEPTAGQIGLHEVLTRTIIAVSFVGNIIANANYTRESVSSKSVDHGFFKFNSCSSTLTPER